MGELLYKVGLDSAGSLGNVSVVVAIGKDYITSQLNLPKEMLRFGVIFSPQIKTIKQSVQLLVAYDLFRTFLRRWPQVDKI